MKALRILAFVLSMILATSPAFAVGFGGINFDGEPYITFDHTTSSFYLTMPEIQAGDLQGWVKWKLNLSNAGWEPVAAGLESDIHGTSTASGNYVYDPQRGVIIFNVQNTDFVGCGLNWGVQVWFISALTPGTVIMSNPLEGGELTMTRQGEGSGILGTWNTIIGSNTFTVTLNGDGTFTALATIVQCD